MILCRKTISSEHREAVLAVCLEVIVPSNDMKGRVKVYTSHLGTGFIYDEPVPFI
jgi:hypothetical protein